MIGSAQIVQNIPCTNCTEYSILLLLNVVIATTSHGKVETVAAISRRGGQGHAVAWGAGALQGELINSLIRVWKMFHRF